MEKWEKQARRSMELFSPRTYRVGQVLLVLAVIKVLLTVVVWNSHIVLATIIGCLAIITGAAGAFLVSTHGRPKG